MPILVQHIYSILSTEVWQPIKSDVTGSHFTSQETDTHACGKHFPPLIKQSKHSHLSVESYLMMYTDLFEAGVPS